MDKFNGLDKGMINKSGAPSVPCVQCDCMGSGAHPAISERTRRMAVGSGRIKRQMKGG